MPACTVEGCTRAYYAKGFCKYHYQKSRWTPKPVNLKHQVHKLSHLPEYGVWCGIKKRCYNQKDISYPNYGGRGIVMCEAWRNSFPQFLADMGPRPEGCSIERLDNDGPYCPTNCKWATRTEQNRNQRDTKLTWELACYIRSSKESKTVLAKRFGVSRECIKAVRHNKIWREPPKETTDEAAGSVSTGTGPAGEEAV